MFAGRDRALGEQLISALGIGLCLLELGLEGVPTVLCLLDLFFAGTSLQFSQLGGSRVAPGFQFGRFEVNDEIPFLECLPLDDMDVLDPAAVARSNANFISFNGAGNERRPGRTIARDSQ